VLVLDQNQRVIGKISQMDALRALEPKYNDIQADAPGSAFRHFSKVFLKSVH